VFRQSCIYGPRQFGVEDQGWVAHFMISAVLGRPITIYGDGRQVRDILHVDDLMRAFDLAVEHIDLSRGQAYNLGGGSRSALSLLELIYRLEADLDHPIPLWFDEWRTGDQRVYISDIGKAERDLGWVPQISIEQGLVDLRHWVEHNVELFDAQRLAMPQSQNAPSTLKEIVR
jgi:CDP-paratose 2-epimerase